ncbi:MAG TPA: hypothetical protein VGB15_09275 [Longimicrobium sp.]|jgi:hypothetical protein
MGALSGVDIAGVVIALLALGVSIFQVRWTARESRYASTFDHLRKFAEILHRATKYDLDAASDEYLAFYKRRADELSPGATEFGALLTELDFLCVAMKYGRADTRIVTAYLSTAIGSMSTKVESVIVELRESIGDPTVFSDLGRMLPTFAPKQLKRGKDAGELSG